MRLSLALLTLVPLTVHAAAPGATQDLAQLDGSKSLFAVLAAINVAGYDAEIDSPSTHPMRLQLRQALAGRELKTRRELKEFYAAHRKPDPKDDLAQYISYALSVDGPPDFKWRYSTDRTPPSATALETLGPLLAAFWKEADLDRFWNAAQPAYDAIIARYQPGVVEAVMAANLYTRTPTSGLRGRRFQVYIDLLGAPNQVHTRGFSTDYFVVATPSAEPRIGDIRHAYLHYLVDPLVVLRRDALEKKKSVCHLASRAPALSEIYKEDCTLLASMSLVRAIESRLDRDPAEVAQAMREGFVLTGYFAEALARYEKQEQSLRYALEPMIEAINSKREEERVALVQFLQHQVERKAAPATAAPPSDDPLEARLKQAERHIKKREIEPARALCREVLEAPAPPAVHARAYFGLARLAALDRDPELSKQLFEKTLSLEPEPFERAWAHVYLARLAMAAGEGGEAAREYAEALKVDGASEQARAAAEAEIGAARNAAPQQ